MDNIDFEESLSASQRKKIMRYIEEHGSITSLEATHALDIMSPRKRLSEINRIHPLRKEVQYNTTLDSKGHKHTVRYIRYSFYE